jgi:hypothetical protein
VKQPARPMTVGSPLPPNAADVAAGLVVEWRPLPHGGEEADHGDFTLRAFCRGFAVVYRGCEPQHLTEGAADVESVAANKRAAEAAWIAAKK